MPQRPISVASSRSVVAHRPNPVIAVGGDHPFEPRAGVVAGARTAEKPHRVRIGVDRRERVEIGLAQRSQHEALGPELVYPGARLAHAPLR